MIFEIFIMNEAAGRKAEWQKGTEDDGGRMAEWQQAEGDERVVVPFCLSAFLPFCLAA
jgi:sulfur relay (sulfurtransferase) complex TusBCD TusD component (DsrE family)